MKKARASLIASVAIGLLAISTAGVSTYAWFQANASATINATSASTTITVSKPDDYTFYAYKGNKLDSWDSSGTFNNDFVALTTSSLVNTYTSFEGIYPGKNMIFALPPQSSAMDSSENPMSLASLRTSGVSPALILYSMLMMFLSFLMKNTSQWESSAIFSGVQPLLRASPMTKMRWSVAFFSRSSMSLSRTSKRSSPLTPISRDLSPLRRASSNDLPMAIVSPVDFICVPRCLSTVRNLSKGHLAIFSTT